MTTNLCPGNRLRYTLKPQRLTKTNFAYIHAGRTTQQMNLGRLVNVLNLWSTSDKNNNNRSSQNGYQQTHSWVTSTFHDHTLS